MRRLSRSGVFLGLLGMVWIGVVLKLGFAWFWLWILGVWGFVRSEELDWWAFLWGIVWDVVSVSVLGWHALLLVLSLAGLKILFERRLSFWIYMLFVFIMTVIEVVRFGWVRVVMLGVFLGWWVVWEWWYGGRGELVVRRRWE